MRLTDGEKPLRSHSKGGVDGAVLADVSQGVEPGQHVGEHQPTVAAVISWERLGSFYSPRQGSGLGSP